MNNFEIFKLKKAGLTNMQIHRVLDYQIETGKSLSARNVAVVSETNKPSLFLERYKQLDVKECKEEFQRYPSFSILDDVYPIDLKSIYNPPVFLFYQGSLDLLQEPKLSVVGTRKATKEGVATIQKVLSELDNQFVIVSGLAKGIDAAAHIAAIKNGGKTIGIIGTGLAQSYPKENKLLQDYIAKNHLLLSEYFPDEAPLKFHFPERNRIIAGLSRGVLVAEAKLRSGSLITCERALEEGRDVFAIPGSILTDQSAGCHHLIKEGAKCTTSGSDILEEYL